MVINMKYRYLFTYSEWLYYIYFSFITIGKALGLAANNKILQIMTILAFVMILTKLIITKYTRKEIIICLILGLIGIISYFFTKREGVLLTIITIVSLKNVPYKRVLCLAFSLRCIIFILLVTLSLTGIIENVETVHWRDEVGFITRYALGYDHPNLLHTNFFILVILFIYLFYERLNVISYILMLGINYFIYTFSISRTGFYSTILVVIVTIFLKKRLINKRIFYNICKIAIPFSILFTIITAFGYNNFEVIKGLDRLFSGRIFYSNYFLTYYNWNLFGRSLTNDSNLLDNGYVVLMINYGIVVFLIYVLGYYKVIKKFIKLQMDKELLMICFFSIYGITEGFLPNIFLNLSLIFLSSLIFKINKSIIDYNFEKKKG